MLAFLWRVCIPGRERVKISIETQAMPPKKITPGEKARRKALVEQEKINKITKAIPGSNGILANIARGAGMSRTTIVEFFYNNDDIRAAILAEKEAFIDRAEEGLHRLVDELDLKAIKYYLSTQAKHRGYGPEDRETDAGVQVNINFNRVSKRKR